MPSAARFERICDQGLDDRSLRAALLDEVRTLVPFDEYAWVLTDPETTVGSSPLAEIPDMEDLPALIRAKYLTSVNRWTTLTSGRASGLVAVTGGDCGSSLLWRDLLHRYGVTDVVSTVFVDRFGCWGFLDLWRHRGSFTDTELEIISTMAGVVTPALRTVHLSSFAAPAEEDVAPTEPVVLVLTDELQPVAQTPAADGHLRALLPTAVDQAPIPAAAFHVAGQLLAREAGIDDNPPSARVHLRNGRWVTFRADRLAPSPSSRDLIAVTAEATSPRARASIYARVIGLSGRESAVLERLIVGASTQELAADLFVSPHTVQDHLKSIFRKAGTHSRRVLVARATGTA